MDTSLTRRLAENQIQGLKKFRDELNAEIAYLESIINHQGGNVAQLPSGNVAQLPTEGTYTAELTKGIYDLLVEKRPLHRGTILERLVANGVHVSGQDKLRTLSAHLSHDKRFIPASRGEWTLANPPSGENIVERVETTEEETKLPALSTRTDLDHFLSNRLAQQTG